MPAPIVAVIPRGRIFGYVDLYSVSDDPVAHALPVAVPKQVEIHEVSDDARKLWEIGFGFVGTRLDVERA